MRKIFGYLFLLLGLIVESFFQEYKGSHIPWPIAWFLGGLAISVFGAYLVFSAWRVKKNKASLINKKRTDQLKLSGKRISIGFENLEVLTGYSKIVDNGEPIATSTPSYLMVVAVSDYIDDEPALDQDVEISVLVYKTEYAGKKMKFVSPNIRKDRATLEFLLGNKKQIDLYIDKNDVANFWFDLEFLKD